MDENMEQNGKSDPVKDYQKYQAVRSRNQKVDTVTQPIDERKIAERGSQPYGGRSNCGSKTIFSLLKLAG